MSELIVSEIDSPKGNVKILSLNGEMDEQSVGNLKNMVDGFSATPDLTYLLFDLTSLEFINSKGIGYLVSVHTHLSKFRKVLMLSGAKEAVMDVMSLVGLTSIIKHFNTVDEALSNI